MYQEELIKGFMLGVKDTVLLREWDSGVQYLKNKRYPRKIYKRDFNGNAIGDCWFFKNQEVKAKFIEKNIHNKLKSGVFDHKSMGEILGFPPNSVDIFTSRNFLDTDKIGVDYCGMSYMSYKQSIVKDLYWLLENRGEFIGHDFTIKIQFYENMSVLSCSADDYFKNFSEIIQETQERALRQRW